MCEHDQTVVASEAIQGLIVYGGHFSGSDTVNPRMLSLESPRPPLVAESTHNLDTSGNLRIEGRGVSTRGRLMWTVVWYPFNSSLTGMSEL